MATQFLALSGQDRRLAFDNAAVGLQLSTVILETDFWVSWLLGLLFSQPEWAGQLVFKGGTSLSKVFGVIDPTEVESLLGDPGKPKKDNAPRSAPFSY